LNQRLISHPIFSQDSIQEYFDITNREVKELELAAAAKDREMELLEDNHRVELRVYQQKVKHLEYEHRNSVKGIIVEGVSLLDAEKTSQENCENELLRSKEQLKFEQMEIELVNANKVAEIRQQHDKQITKLRQQFDDGLSELSSRSEGRLQQLQTDLELRRRVEVHEVEERKNQHINDLVKNHRKAFGQMKSYYNTITGQNLQLIKGLQKKVEELKQCAVDNHRSLLEYKEVNQTLSLPLSQVTDEIGKVQDQLRERVKDQMALRNASSRLNSVGKNISSLRSKLQLLEEEYSQVERERDLLYSNFEDSIQRVQQQAEFSNQALEKRLVNAESIAERAAIQVEEVIHAANLDSGEMVRVVGSLNQMLAAKDDALKEVKFLVVKLQKTFNDAHDTFSAKLKGLGIPEEEFLQLGFSQEKLPFGATTAPLGL
jgi:growth arrest-specific protein 8